LVSFVKAPKAQPFETSYRRLVAPVVNAAEGRIRPKAA
jgi:hypothetical protein